MSFRKRLVLLLLLVLMTGALTALCAPFAVAHGIRAWLWSAARNEGLAIEVGKINAPFLGKITIDELSVVSKKTEGREMNVRVSHLVLDLNFRSWLFSQRARFVRAIGAGRVTGTFRRAPHVAAQKFDWRKLAQLLPDSIRLDDLNLDVNTGATSL